MKRLAQVGSGPAIDLSGHLALVQPRVGIGDMVWHLPHVRALARAAGGRVTLVARPRSVAHQLVGAADGVDEIFWVERDQWMPQGRHQGVRGMALLVRELRARRFDAAVLLTRSRNLSLAFAAAGVGRRYGYGVGAVQRMLLTGGPYLPEAAIGLHAFEQAGAWLQAAGVAVAEAEPRLAVDESAMAAAGVRLGIGEARFAALGIASSDAWKKWSVERFAGLAAALLSSGWPALVLIGGAAETAEAAAIMARLEPAMAARVVPVLGWDLREVMAVLARASFYVGNDTAVLNIAAAVGTRSYGLFGATPVLRHSSQIVPIVPPGGLDPVAGMAAISVAAVLSAMAGSGFDHPAL